MERIFQCANIDEAAKMICSAALEALNKLLLHQDATVLKLVARALEHLFKTGVDEQLLSKLSARNKWTN